MQFTLHTTCEAGQDGNPVLRTARLGAQHIPIPELVHPAGSHEADQGGMDGKNENSLS